MLKTPKHVILTIVITIFLFIVMEIAVNVAVENIERKKSFLDERSDYKRWTRDNVLPYRLFPGAKFYHTAKDKKEYRNLVEYNSKGLNDYEYDYNKSKNVLRILVLGDSFVEAAEVKKEENFCKILENSLNKQKISPKYEVINMGVFGYSPVLEYLYFKTEGLKYDPDMVILCFFVNDVYEDAVHKSAAQFGADNLPIKVSTQQLDRTSALRGWKRYERKLSGSVKGLLARSKVYGYLKKQLYFVLAKMKLKEMEPQDNPFFIISGESSVKDDGKWNDTFAYISGVKKLAEAKGAKFLLISIPIESQLSNNPGVAATGFYFDGKPVSERCESMIEKLCDKNNMEYISLFREFQGYDAEKLYFKNDGHFKPEGHKVVAGIMLDKLKDLGR